MEELEQCANHLTKVLGRVITEKEYKGHVIEHNLYGKGEYSVQYCGDDCWFRTEESARAFIDEITAFANRMKAVNKNDKL